MAIDLGRTHARNPQWTGHARFHVVWQAVSTFALSAIEVLLLLAPGVHASERFYLAAGLAAVPMLGFAIAFGARAVFGGTLSDPNGMRPARVTWNGGQYLVDLNLAAEIAGIAALITIVAAYVHAAA